jgi:hypothetical protein
MEMAPRYIRPIACWLLTSCGAALILMAGCAKSGESVPATPAMVRTIRQQVATTNPSALVGVVIAVEPKGRPFAAVGDVPAQEFHEGDPIAFIDSNQNELTHGIVRRVVADAVHVEWFKPTNGQREPRVGDLAVRYRATTVPMTSTPPPPPNPSEPPPTTAPQ